MWSGKTESNCRHEFPGLGCLRYTTPRFELVRQVRLELTIPCLRGRCLDPIWLLTHGGTERTRTVIGLVDNQVPHLSATVPNIADFQLPIADLCFGLRVFGLRSLSLSINRKSAIKDRR